MWPIEVTTTGNGKLDLQMISDNGQYIYWNLYDGDGTTLLKSSYTSGTKSSSSDGLAANLPIMFMFIHIIRADSYPTP